MNHTFYICDVFAEQKYAGNQLAVFRNAGDFPDREMQKIAKEMNYSETTFIMSEEEIGGGYNVRIFTPEAEIPFAGHPTLGTAFVIQQEIIQKQVSEVVLNLEVGQIPVAFEYLNGKPDILWMKQNPPEFFSTFEPEQIAPVLSLDEKDIDHNYPIEEVSTGFPFVVVPLKSLDAVKRAKIVRDKCFELIKDIKAKAFLVFCREPYSKENDLNVRVFVDYYGIPEDPATGSGNGCLAGYLVKNLYFGKGEIDIRVEQGYEIGRHSLLFLRAVQVKGGIDVLVGGRVVMVARGEFV